MRNVIRRLLGARLPLAATLIGGIALHACGEESLVQPPPPSVASVVVTPEATTLVSLGETVQLTASAQDANGNPVSGQTFTWTSSHEGVATVSATGQVAAVGNGSATIGATIGGVSGTGTVRVDQVVVALQVTPATDTLTALAATMQLTAQATDARGNTVAAAALTWTTSDAGVATVDASTGLVTAVDNGEVMITGTADGISGTAMIAVADPVGVGPNGNTISAADGAVTLVFPAGAVDEAITVTVDAAASLPNPAMRLLPGAAFDFGPDGTQFNAPVPLTITYDPAEVPAGTQESSLRLFRLVDAEWVQVSGSTVDVASQTVTGEINSFSVYGVLLVPIAAVTITPESAEILKGATVQLEATLQDLDGSVLTGREPTWASSDEAVARVDVTGLVTGVAQGTVTITATSEGQSGSATITVVVPTGDLQVLASTSGEALDPDGYIVTVDGTDSQAVGPNGTVTFLGLAAGDHSIELTGVAANCTVAGDNPRTVNVPFAHTAQTTFDVTCQPLPEINLSPSAANFVATEGEADPAAETVSVTNSGGGTLTGLALGAVTYGAGQPTGWLTARLSGTTAPATITLRAATGSLAVGAYTATVPVTSGVASNSPQVIDVTFTVQARPTTVTDLAVVGQNSTILTVKFTEVDNGIGGPADYDIRHAVSPIHWGEAVGSSIVVTGTQVGRLHLVSIGGLSPATQYDVQLVAFRGTLNVDAVFSDLSNIATGTTVSDCTLNTPGDADGDRLPDCVETNTGVFVSELDTGTDPNNPDTDDDALPDGDEVLGTLLGLDLPWMGVSPLRKDILIEYDWFDDALQCGSHSHRPTAATVAMVTAAFVNAPVVTNPDGSTGINFIHDYGQDGDPSEERPFTGGNLIADADGVLDGGVNGAEFLNYKSANFASNRNGYFHYTMLPHRYNTNSGSSGQAEFPGDDLIVSLHCAGSDRNVAHTILHELGHNLFLHHGGFQSRNYKPNYNSVMNYKYQFSGIDNNCTPPGDGVLDYSIGGRPPLNESNLDETQGVCGNPPGPGWDWNRDGDATDVGIAVDINNADGIFGILQDYNDWANLFLGGISDADGALLANLAREIISCMNPAPVEGR